MAWITVDSSWLRQVSYDTAAKQMQVKFKDGHVATFKDVPPQVYDGLIQADSAGKYFHKHIMGKYEKEEVP